MLQSKLLLCKKERIIMFIQAAGRNSDGTDNSFIVFSLKELLKKMKEKGLDSCTILPGDLDKEIIEIRRVTQDDVERMIKNGEV